MVTSYCVFPFGLSVTNELYVCTREIVFFCNTCHWYGRFDENNMGRRSSEDIQAEWI